jgi:hypothetical protein
MPFCGNEQDRAQQHRVVLAGGHHEKKNTRRERGHPDSGFRGRITQQALGPYNYAAYSTVLL